MRRNAGVHWTVEVTRNAVKQQTCYSRVPNSEAVSPWDAAAFGSFEVTAPVHPVLLMGRNAKFNSRYRASRGRIARWLHRQAQQRSQADQVEGSTVRRGGFGRCQFIDAVD